MSPKPQPGRQYTVTEDGESAEDIAAQAYGDPAKAGLLWGSNALPAITPLKKGDVVIIPGEPPADKITAKGLTVIIAGREVPMLACRIVRTMDTGCDGWAGTIAWTPGADAEIDRVTRPYGYERAAAYIDGQLQVSGCLYAVAPQLTDTGRIKNLTGYSFTADAIDSHMPPPYERSGVTLEQLAGEIVPRLGIKAVFQASTGGAFARVTAHESDTIFSHLSKLAAERGLLVSCTPQGDLLIHRAVTDGKPVGSLVEGQPPVTEWKAEYDGRQRFHSYKCVSAGVSSTAVPLWGQGEATTTKVGAGVVTAIDPGVPRSRFMTFRADDTTPGNAQDAVRWAKNKQMVAALTQELPVSDWYAPNGSIWEVNTLVTVVSATLGVPKGYTFLIRAVEFLLEDRRSAVLHLCPPTAYSPNKDLGEIWSL